MKSTFISSLLCLVVLSTSAQLAPDIWHVGTVYTSEGDSLKGLLKYSFENEYVLIKAGKKEYSFTPPKIKGFWIIDLSADSLRRDFKIINFKNKKGLERPEMFEVLTSNDSFSVLVKEEVVYVNQGSFMTQGFASTRSLQYSYYYLEGSVLKPFVETKKQVLTIMADHEEEIKTYAKIYRLKFFRKADLKKLFEQYFKLQSKDG